MLQIVKKVEAIISKYTWLTCAWLALRQLAWFVPSEASSTNRDKKQCQVNAVV